MATPKQNPKTSVHPPRTINVQKFAQSRAEELKSIQSIVSDRLGGDFRIRRDKRRRTTGHKAVGNRRRWLKRRKIGGDDDENLCEGPKSNCVEVKMSRRARRRVELKQNPAFGFCVASDGSRRLRTHVWHAKRFSMAKRWGFRLPLGLHGRGRGSRALLRWFKCGALVHDASYWMPMQLEGREGDLLAVMKMILAPLPYGSLDVADKLGNQIAHGVCYGKAMLYHIEGPFSKLISPVIYMWRPSSQAHKNVRADQDTVFDSFGKDENSTSQRKLWIWIHAAAFSEAFNVLNLACAKQVHEHCAPVKCLSLEGQIARLEMMGSRATEILKKILHPVAEVGNISGRAVSNESDLTACTASQVQKSFILSHAEQLPPYGILSLTVHDPRESSLEEVAVELDGLSTVHEYTLQGGKSDHSCSSPCMTSNVEDNKLLSLWSKPETHSVFLSDDTSLWNSGEKLSPPRSEKNLCKEKEDRRLKNFFLELLDNGEPTLDGNNDSNRCCSIFLLKHVEQGSFDMGWSIILPLSWVKVFWISLVNHGAHGIGLREKRWVACNSGLPSFPYDFPDSNAYSSFMADEAMALDREADLRPLAMRPSRIPIPPPWNSIVSTVIKGPYSGDFTRMDMKKPVGISSEGLMLVSDDKDIASLCSDDTVSPLERQSTSPFPGCVLRTPQDIQWYLGRIGCMKSILLPDSEEVDNRLLTGISRYLNLMNTDRELCFIRVLLHTFKEGVFEEGAIVCAPCSDDLSQWTRSEKEEEHNKLEIPQCFIGSCFKEQPSGRWELHVPEDSQTRQTFRWPIGFVTSGFVHGSSKPVAVGFVEAKLLARLRDHQLKEMQTTPPEIYVFVRNMRSTTYRRALATVVLEKWDDIEFM